MAVEAGDYGRDQAETETLEWPYVNGWCAALPFQAHSRHRSLGHGCIIFMISCPHRSLLLSLAYIAVETFQQCRSTIM